MPDGRGPRAARAAADGRDVRSVDVAYGPTTFPARLLTQRVTYIQDGQTYFLQALQDRSTEVATLQSLLVTLLVGGIVVVLVAFAVGAVYASRALVPIRQSLETQRVALRRQREFAADASHELRTPLTVIRSSVEHLQRHQDRPVAASVDALEDIDAEVTHLTALVDDLLLLARSDSGAVALETQTDGPRRRRVRRGRIVRAGRRGARRAGRRRPGAGDDPGRPGAAPPAGDDPRRQRRPPQPARRRGRPSRSATPGSLAAIEVRDQGPGVREEDMPHVFDRFWRAPGAPSGGTGLGLAIAKWIVDRHGGRIGVANRPEGGAAFRVELPAFHPGPSAAPVPRPAPSPRRAGAIPRPDAAHSAADRRVRPPSGGGRVVRSAHPDCRSREAGVPVP